MSSAYEEAQPRPAAEAAVGATITGTETTAVQRRYKPSLNVSLQTFAALRYRDFAFLWSGAAVMSAGQWLQQVTLSWLVYEMTGSAFALGLINGVRTLPFLFIGLFSGTVADRMDRRLLMLLTQAYLVATTAVLAVLLLTGKEELWHLLVYSMASGAGWAFVWPVRQAVVPTLVPREELLSATALLMAAVNFMRIIGPAIGGFLLASLGGGGNFTAQVVLYASVIFLILAMRVPPVPAPESGRRSSVFASTIEGLRYVRSNDLVMALLIILLIPMTLAMPYMSLLAIFAGDVYDIGSGGLGILLAFGGVGSLIGTLILASVGDLRRKGMVLISAQVAMGVCLAIFGQISWLPLALLFLVLISLFQVTFVTLNQTILQAVITDDMRGRVASLHMLEYGFIPAGTFAAGAIADVIGAQNTISIMGIVVTGVALVAIARLKNLRTA